MKMIYLAGPYTSKDATIQQRRFEDITKVAAFLMKEGYNVFSPITHSHPLTPYLTSKENEDHDFWLERDYHYLMFCDELWVLCLDGYLNSYGVKQEILKAREYGMPVRFKARAGAMGLLEIKSPLHSLFD